MKEVLIYGALVAAVIGASVPVIQGLTNTMTNQAGQINQAVDTQITGLIDQINSGSGS